MTLSKQSTYQQRHSASGSQSTRLCLAAALLLFCLLAREVSEARMQSQDYSEGCCWLQDYWGGYRSERFERSFVEEFAQIFALREKLKLQYETVLTHAIDVIIPLMILSIYIRKCRIENIVRDEIMLTWIRLLDRIHWQTGVLHRGLRTLLRHQIYSDLSQSVDLDSNYEFTENE